ncbi:response regulator [Rhodococcus sp. T2V]|uniref:response regulator n=1 Tax=Rhodococcus sp. T2V TaxID=3034164 RepID=UPI0023E26E6D|nr:response regulator [Rhodococcus sp. T2V]MDF3307926.1 response regulator [Rhodococcus sp. T2V]
MRPRDNSELTVLVVDDDFMVASIHAELVNHEVDGFRVVGTAGTGAKALDMVAALAPDLILLDVHLPDLNGLEVLRRLRERGDDVDAIVVTAERDADSVKAALRGGAAQYLVKPFDLDELKARILGYAAARLEKGNTDQTAIDAAFSLLPGRRTPVSPPPKGLSNESLDLVRNALAAGQELSATECGQATGMARSTVRRYLEYLVESGEATVRHKYGGGRPERLYRTAR